MIFSFPENKEDTHQTTKKKMSLRFNEVNSVSSLNIHIVLTIICIWQLRNRKIFKHKYVLKKFGDVGANIHGLFISELLGDAAVGLMTHQHRASISYLNCEQAVSGKIQDYFPKCVHWSGDELRKKKYYIIIYFIVLWSSAQVNSWTPHSVN